jgi:hypothetical protein
MYAADDLTHTKDMTGTGPSRPMVRINMAPSSPSTMSRRYGEQAGSATGTGTRKSLVMANNNLCTWIEWTIAMWKTSATDGAAKLQLGSV